MGVRLNLDILSPERLTVVNVVATALGAMLASIPGLGVGLLVDAVFETENSWLIGALSTSVLGTILLTGIVSYEKN